MRLRFLLPRRGRRRGFGRLERPGAALAVALVLAGCGGSATVATITVVAPRAPRLPVPPSPRLAIGLTEFNASLLARDLPAPAGFEQARAQVDLLDPTWFRLVVDWHALQPRASAAPDFGLRQDGCLRGLPPCAPFAGLRDVLRAVAGQQRAHPGRWRLLVVLTGTPAWAAVGAHGCELPRPAPVSRAVDSSALPRYRGLIRGVLAEARAEGAQVQALSPWNEPNNAFFISPQRERCDARAPLLSPAIYARLARAAQAELRGRGVRLVLGELAGAARPRPLIGDADEFIRALPADVACAADVWSQHDYVRPGEDAAAPAPVDQLEQALDGRACTRGRPIWVTETGAGGAHPGAPRSGTDGQLAAGCRAQAAALARWSRDRRVEAAFQYTFRDDTAFPVGLSDARLTRVYPSYPLWLRAGLGRYSC